MGRFFIYILTGIILICSCNNKERKQTDENTISNSITTLHTDSVQGTDTLAKVQIEDPHFNFGEIQKGEIVTHTFKIKNTGTKNLLITHTESSCGCTIPKYDKKPIPRAEKEKSRLNSTLPVEWANNTKLFISLQTFRKKVLL